jgi:hypothetical protein
MILTTLLIPEEFPVALDPDLTGRLNSRYVVPTLNK